MTYWMQTYTGRQFFPTSPRTEDIDILDIAHALSLTCRYGGHVDRFPADYIWGGTRRERVKLCGNAVTPPAARDLIAAVAESLVGAA